MKIPPAFLSITAALLLVAVFAVPRQSTGAADPDSAAIANLIREVQAQQTTALANHAKIDAKLVAIEEDLRQARIFVSRGGGKTDK